VQASISPLVGVPCHAGRRAQTRRPIYYNNKTYIHAIERAGGVPVMIPILQDLNGLAATLLPHLHGLLLSGGLDIDPSAYGQEPLAGLRETNPDLDRLELRLARWALEEDVPMLGICRGMQLLNVALGGKLYQDLERGRPGSLRHDYWHCPRNTIVHQLSIAAGSRMAQTLGACSIAANSLHHQGISEPGRSLVISGWAEDGVAELVEVPGYRFMLATQCHPEELAPAVPSWSRLFKAFIEACRQRAADTMQLAMS
jgi:putative glutamine amidotransferase